MAGDNATRVSESSKNVDAAWTYLNNHNDAIAEIASANIQDIRRRIDWHIVPLMFACYTMQFLDKVILNYAAVMGLQKDLSLKGNEFSNVATFLFVGLLCFEIPNSTCFMDRCWRLLKPGSLLPSNGASCKVAGHQCCFVGCRYGMWRCGFQLPDTSRLQSLPWYL
jgi:hypothetical protein